MSCYSVAYFADGGFLDINVELFTRSTTNEVRSNLNEN